MIHHQPTKYHHANPLTHFLNLHNSHATAAAAAALALATDGLGQHHGHYPYPATTSQQAQQQQQQQQQQSHLSSPPQYEHQSLAAMADHRRLRAENRTHEEITRSGTGESGRTDEEGEEEDQDGESGDDRSCSGEIHHARRSKRRSFEQTTNDLSEQGEASESEHNIDVDVDDPEPRDDVEQAMVQRDRCGTPEISQEIRGRSVGAARDTSSSVGEMMEEEDDEEIVIDGKGSQHDPSPTKEPDEGSNRGACASPCNDTSTTVLDTDGFVGKSFTIAAILGLKKKQDEAAAAAAAVAGNEYGEGAMNLSTGAFQPHHQHHHHHQNQQQRAAAAAAVAAAAIGRLPLVMAAAAAGIEKRDRADSVDSVDACGSGTPLTYGVRPLSAGQHPPPAHPVSGALTALQNLHQLPGLHGSGGGFSAFHPSSGNGGSHASPHHQQHPANHHHAHHAHHAHHHHHHHQFGGHHFHHLQGQSPTQLQQHQQQQQQHQQHQQQMQQHSAHPQQQQHVPGAHHMALAAHHQSHNRDKFKDLGKKSSLSSSAASLKSKRVRTIFTPEQLERLEAEFERQQYMVGPERLYLAHTLQLTEAQVKVWFQNRRIKWRKHHLEITQQRLALIRQRQIANGVSTPTAGPQVHLAQQTTQAGGMSGGRMINPIESPDLTICTDSMDARSGSEGDD